MTRTDGTQLSTCLSKVKGVIQKSHRWLLAAIIVSCLSTLIYYNSRTQQRITSLQYVCDCLRPVTGCEQICQPQDNVNLPVGRLMPVDLDSESNKNLKFEKDSQDKTADANNFDIEQAGDATRLAQNPAETANNAHPVKNSKSSTSQIAPITKLPSINGEEQQTSISKSEHPIGEDNSVKQQTPRKLPVILPGGKQCDACLMGKQLIAVQKGWICGQPRIGNKMFMLIPAITAAYEHNATLVLVQNEVNNTKDCQWSDWLREIFQYFNSSSPLLPEEMLQGWYNFGEPGFTKYTSNFYKPKDNYTVAGYRQSWRYVETAPQQKAARLVFKFTSRYENFAIDTITKAKDSLGARSAIVVGIHMRIGDLLDKTRLDYGYVMAQPEFYKAAIDKAIQTLNSSDIILIVASDSADKAKAMLTSNNITSKFKTHFLHGSAFEDFATLTKCDHTIISGGTYGWWAAWLAGGKTFYHANFTKPGSDYAKGFTNERFYVPDWIPIYTLPQEKPSAASSIPDVIMPDGQNCTNCLADKQLVTLQKGWLCSSPRLGHKMFMLAPAIADTVLHNATLVMIQESEACDWVKRLQGIFEIFNSSTPLLKHTLIEDWLNLAEHNGSHLHPEVYVPGKNFTFSGYRQNWRYVETPAAIAAVKRGFKLTQKYINHAQSTIHAAKSNFSAAHDPLIVGVHVKMADLNSEHGHQMANLTFYVKSMFEVKRAFTDKDLIFVVTSDKIKSAKALLVDLSNTYDIYFVSPSSGPEDFAVLSHCDHMIISGGTFGYWAAFLSGGKVYYHSQFARPGSEFAKEFQNENLYRPDWIGIGVS